MAFTGPLSVRNAGIPPRPKRQPRKLDYLKCSSCRQAKVKCIPRNADVADGKCTRCSHKNLLCSGLHRKYTVAVQPQSPEQEVSVPCPTQSDAEENYEDEQDALILLSLFHVLDLAIQELIVIGKEQLLFMSHNDTAAWGKHLRRLDVVVEYYSYAMKLLEDSLKPIPHVSRSIISAIMNLKYPSHNTDRTASVQAGAQLSDLHLSEDHYGMAYIFQMRTLEYTETPEEDDVKRLLQTRDKFIVALERVLKRRDISLTTNDGNAPHLGPNLSGTQLFIPRNLLQIPTLAAAIEKDGRRDLLCRLPSHILYDAKINMDSGFDIRTDDSDALGRSTLHIACSMTTQERQRRRLDLSSVAWPGRWMLGLNALHIAAARGDLEIFQKAVPHGYHFLAAFHGVLRRTADAKQTYIHLAAHYGHLELTQFLIGRVPVGDDVLYNIDDMGKTALYYAARYGHTDIVKIILSHPISKDFVGRDPDFDRPIFFSAVIGGHWSIIQLLESRMNVNVDVDDWYRNELGMVLTPLAEVARQGSLDCVEYFLNHEKVAINHRNQLHLRTALDYAITNENDECVEVMRRYGAMTYTEMMDSIFS